MTIAEAIARLEAARPNQHTAAQRIQWLSDCDSAIFTEIISTHEPDENTPESFSGYASDVDTGTSLLVGAPYDVLYERWLLAQTDFYNSELSRFNNTSAMYNVARQSFANYYNRTHMPKQAATYIKVGGAYVSTQTSSSEPL